MLKHLYIPSSISSIGYDIPILKGCTRLTSITIPFVGKSRLDVNTETAVVGALFGYDDSDITETMQYYNSNGDYHYYKVPRTLKTVNILNQTDIPAGAFMGCDFLENAAVVTGAKMNDYAFYQCASLKTAVLPKDLQTIGYEAFAECENLQKVNIPIKVKTIGENAFYNCRALVDVTMPDSITEIKGDVFNGTNLASRDVNLAAGRLTITCSKDSAAYNFAVENGYATNIVSSNALDKKTVGATIDKLSTGEYLLEVIDTNKLSGTLYVAIYDNNGKLLLTKSNAATEDGIEYRITFSEDEMKNFGYAKVFIWGGNGGMTPQTTECAVINEINID